MLVYSTKGLSSLASDVNFFSFGYSFDQIYFNFPKSKKKKSLVRIRNVYR